MLVLTIFMDQVPSLFFWPYECFSGSNLEAAAGYQYMQLYVDQANRFALLCTVH